MFKFIKKLLVLVFILVLQVLIYFIFIEPIITQWGASKEEVSMSMVGDNDNLNITSTRAIQIDANKHIIWQLLMQLGANRQGFYSYDFIEHELGNEAQYQSLNTSKNTNLKVGDIVHGSRNKGSALSVYNFPVLYVKPEESLVLENWGTFLVKSINEKQSRLIVRTQEKKSVNLWTSFKNHLIIPFHYIMERRMLLGLKMHSEQSNKFSPKNDLLWFGGVVSLFCLILLLFFRLKGILLKIIITSFFAILWQVIVFLFEPIFLYSAVLLVVICFILFKIWGQDTN
ncbi:hypothetical protein Arnit_1207 [Arcobacter nitrofigilis DSM 7299]|uniref:Uncharacterized protein n=1 Tax=Arcobacter nitrofigilis (strain ATCC 33309 / DSM 7299 / CCUG 15893 / LMG 7604 / NCTC 12251 / CI) TaxID=572480 RepID=D5V438_ARCNC|nr:hypothetical protein [Arcobacter nitrofigilis]ADG92866.1 hypothetical protein Arnit_1207 [Arcobacter nitrofigilis DSM 7299]